MPVPGLNKELEKIKQVVKENRRRKKTEKLRILQEQVRRLQEEEISE